MKIFKSQKLIDSKSFWFLAIFHLTKIQLELRENEMKWIH